MRYSAIALSLLMCVLPTGISKAAEFPEACALFPILTFPSGTLYYSEYYATSCEDEPEVYYLFGHYSWPCHCPTGCVNVSDDFATLKSRERAPFPGLDAPMLPTDTIKLVSGPARDYSRIFVDPAIPYITFQDVDQNTRYAKVFACGIDTKGVATEHGQYMNRLVYVALESTLPEKATYVPVSCMALDPEPAAGTWQCHAYRAIYQPSPTQKHQILVLAAKKQQQPTLAAK